MTWQVYKLTYRLLTPVHIGHYTVGNVKYTRRYVLGRNMWGAVTARLARILAGNGQPDYAGVGRQVEAQIVFTYLYPTTDPEQFSSEMLPPYDDSWERRFIDSFVSTAVEHGSMTATDESLHEVEFIRPRVGPDETDRTYLVGYICLRDDMTMTTPGRLWEALRELQIGGEQGYGWGHIRLGSSASLPQRSDGDIFGYPVDTAGDRPIVTVNQGKLPAHVEVNGIQVRGEIEPLVGRETDGGGGFGHRLTRARLCWTPGSVTLSPVEFIMGPKGLWKAKQNDNLSAL